MEMLEATSASKPFAIQFTRTAVSQSFARSFGMLRGSSRLACSGEQTDSLFVGKNYLRTRGIHSEKVFPKNLCDTRSITLRNVFFASSSHIGPTDLAVRKS